MMMPVYERRFFIDLLIKQREKTTEDSNNATSNNSNAKGSRQSKISGDALKTKMQTGQIPLN